MTQRRSMLSSSERDKKAALKDQIVALSIEYRVLCPLTALLVLETEADYVRFNITRKSLTDILVVESSEVVVNKRKWSDLAKAPPPPKKPKPMKKAKGKKKNSASRRGRSAPADQDDRFSADKSEMADEAPMEERKMAESESDSAEPAREVAERSVASRSRRRERRPPPPPPPPPAPAPPPAPPPPPPPAPPSAVAPQSAPAPDTVRYRNEGAGGLSAQGTGSGGGGSASGAGIGGGDGRGVAVHRGGSEGQYIPARQAPPKLPDANPWEGKFKNIQLLLGADGKGVLSSRVSLKGRVKQKLPRQKQKHGNGEKSSPATCSPWWPSEKQRKLQEMACSPLGLLAP
ncbi:MAG: hypothetical protein GY822_13000 [Deltaproteobacteria bacterium]|nr:hypothetical protein [Deltaproteobacteria bacterium]